MSTLKDDLKKMDSLSGKELDLFLVDMKARYTSPEDKKTIRKHLLGELDDIKSEMKEIDKELTIKEQLKDISEVVSLSYIAKKYFGKSRAWLYQRINGNAVRGQVYKLSPEEIDTLNFALRDISNKIGSLSIKC
ncbi:DUF5053 domain-containing protein [Parabacteroides provencensis]|uniref:DUF5053 domain-containing protein n=1 Tax=Parabacteroides provencensis TaxID=1944636 RepID=UPI000C152DF1|nr:DUF5053 domain-containing protein [Parabacteroides provencensis]